MMGVSPPAASGNGSKTVRPDNEVGAPLREGGGRVAADADAEDEDEDEDGAAAPFLRTGSRLNTKSSSDSSASAVMA